MHPIVVAEREGLHLGVEVEAHPVADELPHRLPLVVLHHRAQSPKDGDGEDQGRGADERRAGLGVVAHRSEHPLRMVDGLADELRDDELRERREHGGPHAERQPPRMGEGHAGDAQQHFGIERDRGAPRAHRVGHESERSVGGGGSGGCGHGGDQGSRGFWGRTPRRARGGARTHSGKRSPSVSSRIELGLTCDIASSGGLKLNANLHADLGLEGKVAIVAGGGAAGDGIGNGRAAAILLARAGASVFVVDRSLDLAEGTVGMIASEGGEAAAHEANLADESQCAAMVEAALARFGRVDVLDNNVGIASLDTVVAETQSRWERVMRVNVETMFLVAKHTIPAMIESGDGGAIVNISSIAALRRRAA